MSQPTEPKIVAAIAAYRQHIVEHNGQVFAKLVHEAETAGAPADWSEEDTADARRDFILNQLCVSQLALDGTAVEHDGTRRALLREQYGAGVVAGLQQQQPGGEAPLPFPADFAVLMAHVDGLEGPGWPLWRENGQQVRFWDGLGESEEDVRRRVWADLDGLKAKAGEASWEMRAGWECGAGPDATCFVIYFRDTQSGNERRRSWGWRYVVQVETTVWAFEDVVELLGWNKRFREPVLEDIDLVSGRVFE